LGDIQKRSVDGVVMGYLGNRPNLRIYQPGSSIYDDDILSAALLMLPLVGRFQYAGASNRTT